MSTGQKTFIELNRQFRRLEQAAAPETNAEASYRSRFESSSTLSWEDILRRSRVVILGEAGSGKTEEFQNRTRLLTASMAEIPEYLCSSIADALFPKVIDPRQLVELIAKASFEGANGRELEYALTTAFKSTVQPAADAGKAIGKTDDGGIDGTIKEDRLGLSVILRSGEALAEQTVGRAGGPKVRWGIWLASTRQKASLSRPRRSRMKRLATLRRLGFYWRILVKKIQAIVERSLQIDKPRPLRTQCRKFWRTGWLCVVMAFSLLEEGHAQAASEIPRGVFSSEKAGVPTAPRVLADPAVDGISIREKWRDLEKSKGAYDWSFLDAEIARAEKAGKAVLVRILTEGQSTPEWVYNEGVQTFTYQDNNPYHAEKIGKFALFWDETYLSEKKAMIEAAGAHLAGKQAVRVVAAICVSARTDDWLVPHSPTDIEHWQAVGYTSGKMIDVCKQIIDVTMQSFPRQCVTLAAGRNGKLDPDPDYVARHAVEYARSRYPGRFIVQKNSLSAVSPLPGQGDFFQILWDNRPDIAGQMLWFSYGDPKCRNNGGKAPCDPEVTLRKSVDIGLRYGMKYIEIYQRDVINLPEVIQYAHNSMTK